VSETRVLVLVGSLRAASQNRRLAESIANNAPAGTDVAIAEHLAELPFYNEDLDGENASAQVVEFRSQVAAADRILVVTPEYNGTMPAVINNALDWASRPRDARPIADKPLAVVGSSLGSFGGKWAHDDIRRSAQVAGAQVVEGIELHHTCEPGTDPRADAETIQRFFDAAAKLSAHEGISA
jgi:NAD(P)H-dependent FMN reductase